MIIAVLVFWVPEVGNTADAPNPLGTPNPILKKEIIKEPIP